MSTIKQREKMISRALVALDKAADSLSDLASIAIEFDVDSTAEERFISELKERANYWENCRWWRERS